MGTDELQFSIEDLSRLVDVSVRTIRYYITEGLLPGPEGRGKMASYGPAHLSRLQLIRLLSERRVPLQEIKSRLGELTDMELAAVLHAEQKHSVALHEVREHSPRQYVETLLTRARQQRYEAPQPEMLQAPIRLSQHARGECWRRLTLAPGVELHCSEDAVSQQAALIEKVVRVAESGNHHNA